MKKIAFLLVALLWGSQVFADSYQRWITWSDPKHSSNPDEMAHIIAAIYHGKIVSGTVASFGETKFKVKNPKLYLEYIIRCVKASDPSVKTTEDAIDRISKGEMVQWGNDISCKVRNYWQRNNGEVTFTPNYSGATLGIWVLLINGIPSIKLDCGNPLEVYSEFTPIKKPEVTKIHYDTIVHVVEVQVKVSTQVDQNQNRQIEHPVYDLMNPGAYNSGVIGTVWETPHYGRINTRVRGERPEHTSVENSHYNSVNPGTGNPGASPTHGDGPGASPTHGNGNPGASPTHGGGPGGSSTNGSGGPGGSNTHRTK